MKNNLVNINGTSLEFFPGETVLDVCKRNNIYVPTLCHMKDICESANCRICMVETSRHQLVPACSTKCAADEQYLTDSNLVINSRLNTLKLLLSAHHFDCRNCIKADNCSLQKVATYYGIVSTGSSNFNEKSIDTSSPCIVRDNNKCILCGRCVNVCSKIQNVNALTKIGRGYPTEIGCAFNSDLRQSVCVGCGQCTLVCPTGALVEASEIEDAERIINNKDYFVVAQIAPSVRVALSEAFGEELGTFDEGKMVASIKALGIDKVFDINFGADLTTYLEAEELIDRIKNKQNLPQFSSCCPAWFKYVQHFYPNFKENLSTCKSPTEMLGATLKHFYSKSMGIDAEKIKVISIMPCTAKKGEKQRAKDVDVVLTTREIARMIKNHNINFQAITPQGFDMPYDDMIGGSVIYGASGGVTESVLRYAARVLGDGDKVDFTVVRDTNKTCEYLVECGNLKLSLCIVSGLANANRVMKEIEAGRKHFDFMEVMACPGGCINGGGQTWTTLKNCSREQVIEKRKASLYGQDAVLLKDDRIFKRNVNDMFSKLLLENEQTRHALYHYN